MPSAIAPPTTHRNDRIAIISNLMNGQMFVTFHPYTETATAFQFDGNDPDVWSFVHNAMFQWVDGGKLPDVKNHR